MADERVSRIQEMVAKAQALKDLQARQSQTAQQAKEAAEKAKRAATRIKNIEKLEGTGVVGLFRGLRDMGVVRWIDGPMKELVETKYMQSKWVKTGDYYPAKIEFSDDGSEISLVFNHRYVGESLFHDVYRDSSITARIGWDGLTIGNLPVEDREGARMEDLVTRMIVESNCLTD